MRNDYKMDSITVDKYLTVILQDSVCIFFSFTVFKILLK